MASGGVGRFLVGDRIPAPPRTTDQGLRVVGGQRGVASSDGVVEVRSLADFVDELTPQRVSQHVPHALALEHLIVDSLAVQL